MTSGGSRCPDEGTVVAFLGGQLTAEAAAAFEAHADECSECCSLLVAAATPPGAVRGRSSDGDGRARPDPREWMHLQAEQAVAALRPVADDEYRVGRELARGGMGRILEAVDRHGRRVALKVLLTAGDDAVRRFVREMQVTARLQHPSIVTLHEAGRWPSGEPFFAMKLVEGRSLQEELAEGTAMETRLALLPRVQAVADALAYAHDRGVVHRDLKPSNVLLGAFGETVVIDWGLARLRRGDEGAGFAPPASDAGAEATIGDAAPITRVGAALGTPAYMPPEQAAGKVVDERADVYSLGALLYHVLAGRAPYRGASARDLLRQVIAGPPADLPASLPADLRAIVRKAMRPEPAERYPTAKEMADDLRRYSTGQLVSAHVYSAGALARRWLRRHRAAVTAAAALLVLASAGGAASVAGIVKERNVARAERLVATTHQTAAEKLVEFLIFRFRERVRQAGSLELLAGVGDEVARYYREIGSAGVRVDPATFDRRAGALETLAFVEIERKNVANALALSRQALDLRERAGPVESATAAQLVKRAAGWQEIGIQENEQGRTDAGMEAYRKGLDLANLASRRQPGLIQAHLTAASIMERMAQTLQFRKSDVAGAFAVADDARRRLASVLAQHPDDQRLTIELASLHERCSYQERALARLDAAATSLQQSIDLYRRASKRDPKNLILARRHAGVYISLAGLEESRGRLAEALAASKVHVEGFEASLRADPSNRATQEELGWAYANDCTFKRRARRFDEAEATCNRGLEILRELARRDPRSGSVQDGLINALMTLGAVKLKRGNAGGSHHTLVEAVTVARRLLATDPASPRWRENLSLALSALVEAELEIPAARKEALRHGQEALAMADALATATPDDVGARSAAAGLKVLLGDAARALGRPEEALKRYQSARVDLEALMARAPEVAPVRTAFVDATAKLAGVLETMRRQPGAQAEAARLRAQARGLVEDLRRRGRLFPEDEAHLRTLGMGGRATTPLSAERL